MMDQLGGHSDWTGKIGTRVLPTSVTLVDDPTATQWNGHELIGAYGLDQEGVQGQKVTIVSNGMLRQLLMSRRPGPDFDESNGHGRSTFLSDPKPLISNLFFLSSDEQDAAALRQKFLDACKQNGQAWGLEVRLMDNPTVAIADQDNASDFLATAAGGAATGERLPLLVYRVNLADGHEELVRGARLEGLTLKDLRNLDAHRQRPDAFLICAKSIGGFQRHRAAAVRQFRRRSAEHGHLAVPAVRRNRSPRPAQRAGASAAGAGAAARLIVMDGHFPW